MGHPVASGMGPGLSALREFGVGPRRWLAAARHDLSSGLADGRCHIAAGLGPPLIAVVSPENLDVPLGFIGLPHIARKQYNASPKQKIDGMDLSLRQLHHT